MTDFTGALPASLRPWTRDEGENGSLKTILGRIYEERGHFRKITEDGLRAEIEAKEDVSTDSESAEEDESTQEAKAPKSRPQELLTARIEMIGHVASAQNEALMALDFLSLLLSKDLPQQAATTMSPYLKQQMKPGTLGMDMWQDMPEDREREKNDNLLAKGMKMQALQLSADSLLDAASRLESCVRKETEYWSQVLSISEKGWSVCRMPRERHHLGVRYGFSEAQGEYKNRGLAALRADSEGNILLDRGFGNNPKAIQVRIRDGDRILGASDVPLLTDETDLTVEARIRHARDSLYEEELFHEIILESRQLASYGVRMKGNTIMLPKGTRRRPIGMDDFDSILVDLVPLEDVRASKDDDAPQNRLAQAIALCFRLLLSREHRGRLHRRSQIPAPLSMMKPETAPAVILRPVLNILQHSAAVSELNAYLQRSTSVLSSASISVASTAAALTPNSLGESDSLQAFMSFITAPLKSNGSMEVLIPDQETPWRITFELESAIDAPNPGPVYAVGLPIERGTVRFTEWEDVQTLVDASITGAIAQAVAQQLPSWEYNGTAGMLTEPTARDGGTQST